MSTRLDGAHRCSGGAPTGALVLTALLHDGTRAKGGTMGLPKAGHGDDGHDGIEACVGQAVAQPWPQIRH